MVPPNKVVAQLLPFSLVSFLGFLAVGVPLPALSLYVHDQLGFGTLVVGVVIGLQSLVTLLTRQYAGSSCDRRGSKRTSLRGLGCASVAALLYLASDFMRVSPLMSLVLLCAGRLLLGLAESMFITALTAWSIASVGQQYTGRAMAWSGIAMYAALALGAPLGLVIYRAAGFQMVALCAFVAPLLGAALAARWPQAVVARVAHSNSFLQVLRIIWMPGLGLALASSGVGTVTSFLSLRYGLAHWSHPEIALAGFGIAYIAVRLLFGGLPDRLGGYQTGLASLAVEAIGLLLIWLAASPWLTFAGVLIAGLGYSLVFPSLGVEAIRRVPGEQKGMVIGAYLACFDVGLAIAGPGAGIVARFDGIPAAFAAAGAASCVAVALVCVDFYRIRTVRV